MISQGKVYSQSIKSLFGFTVAKLLFSGDFKNAY